MFLVTVDRPRILGSDMRNVPVSVRRDTFKLRLWIHDLFSRHSACSPNEAISVFQARAFGADDMTRGPLLLSPC